MSVWGSASHTPWPQARVLLPTAKPTITGPERTGVTEVVPESSCLPSKPWGAYLGKASRRPGWLGLVAMCSSRRSPCPWLLQLQHSSWPSLKLSFPPSALPRAQSLSAPLVSCRDVHCEHSLGSCHYTLPYSLTHHLIKAQT